MRVALLFRAAAAVPLQTSEMKEMVWQGDSSEAKAERKTSAKLSHFMAYSLGNSSKMELEVAIAFLILVNKSQNSQNSQNSSTCKTAATRRATWRSAWPGRP